MTFADRTEAGHRLAEMLDEYRGTDAIVCGIPQGGAIVGAEVAISLGITYECLVVCRVGMPCFPDITLAAVDPAGRATFDPKLELTRHEVLKMSATLRDTLKAKVDECRAGRPEPEYQGKTVIVVDEVAASEMIFKGAAAYLRSQGAARLIAATPMITTDVRSSVEKYFDQVVALDEVRQIRSLAAVFAEGTPSEEEISRHLKAAWART